MAVGGGGLGLGATAKPSLGSQGSHTVTWTFVYGSKGVIGVYVLVDRQVIYPRRDRTDSFVNLIAAVVAQTPRLCLVTCASPPLFAMAPKRRGGWAVPKAQRDRAGDNLRLRDSEADANATSEPPLALANHAENTIRFHHSEGDTDDACYVVLMMMNGDQLSYKLPLSVFEIKRKLPQLPAYTYYKLVYGTNLLKGSQVLDGMNYHLSVIVVKVDFADWLPKSWIGAVPNEAQDRLGYLPGSISEAGMAVFHCMETCNVDVASLNFGPDMDRRVEMATHYIIEGDGWQRWRSGFKLPFRTPFSDEL